YRTEMDWVGRIMLQFLPQFQDVIVDSPGGRVVLISPNLVQKFVPGDDALGIMDKEFQRLELLCGQNNRRAVAHDFHLREVDRNPVEGEHFRWRAAHDATQGGPYAGQQFARAEWLGHIIIGAELEQ